MWVPGALVEEDPDVELVLRGKEFHDQLVMSAMGAGNWKWQYTCLTFASLPRHSVTIHRMNTYATQIIITPGIYPVTLFNR